MCKAGEALFLLRISTIFPLLNSWGGTSSAFFWGVFLGPQSKCPIAQLSRPPEPLIDNRTRNEAPKGKTRKKKEEKKKSGK